ncbi:MAG: glycoside hydrolase family 2 protein [Bacteroidetes bacterium]|nr:glycoside hydrolase family 2 protein [Bacteroidota bacterium]
MKSFVIESNWKLRKKGTGNFIDAKVPSCVFTDLMKNKIIKNPFFSDNEKNLQWIAEKEWEYSCKFILPDEILNKKNTKIIFHGLDTYAKVFLNDSLILKADNMFRKWEIDAKPHLKNDENSLKIVFSSVNKTEKQLQSKSNLRFPEGKKSFTRKAAYHYGWDWAPKLLNCGIWKPIEIVAWDKCKINNIYFSSNILSTDKAVIKAEYNISSDEKTRVNIEIKNTKENKIVFSKKFNLKKGSNILSCEFEINNPRLWQVHNIGEPYLYCFENSLSNKSILLDKKTTKTGLRKIELVRDKDKAGKTFYFKLNSNPVFMKGSNYVPQDVFLNRVTADKYEQIIKDAVAANINMLRVWGGGIYENDVFYDLCDQYGILVWQDFMFANNLFPDTKHFIENIKVEAVENVVRLRNHPCLALWCGNNEIDEAWHNWGWSHSYSAKDSARLWENYKTIFHEILPNIVKKFHGDIAYVSSSPKFGRGNKQSLVQGDSHYWGVWHDRKNFNSFIPNTGRFMSEYGFQSYPCIKTIKAFVEEKNPNINSEAILNHQKNLQGNEIIDQYMKQYFFVPKKFSDYVYISQLLQAEGIKIGIEAHRRAKPYCMGSLFWQFNDCWPSVSWSSIDFYGRKKAVYFFAKNSFKNVIVSSVEDNVKLNIFVVSDSLKNFKAKIKIMLINFNGNILKQEESIENISSNSSKIYKQFNIADLLIDADKNKCLLLSELSIDEKKICSDIHYFTETKNLKLKEPTITFKTKKTYSGYIINLASKYLAKNIYLSIDEKGCFTDNYFDIIPGISKQLTFITNKKSNDFDEKIEIKTVYQTMDK